MQASVLVAVGMTDIHAKHPALPFQRPSASLVHDTHLRACHSDKVANLNHASCRRVDGVVAEVHFLPTRSVALEGGDGLVVRMFGSGRRVDGGYAASAARLAAFQLRVGNCNVIEPIFAMWHTPFHHNVGAKVQHADRIG
eukprot:TRINITY_DN11927_c0_g3_i14.p2 TRINITY_DN11927_c0_g3~~TRINITY_DN11927_c0_g3_i14.p2  ORF type:complete len:140 (-),score=11.94 TRINITY_DN11927_c0_g3_i14:825-1244(-)